MRDLIKEANELIEKADSFSGIDWANPITTPTKSLDRENVIERLRLIDKLDHLAVEIDGVKQSLLNRSRDLSNYIGHYYRQFDVLNENNLMGGRLVGMMIDGDDCFSVCRSDKHSGFDVLKSPIKAKRGA